MLQHMLHLADFIHVDLIYNATDKIVCNILLRVIVELFLMFVTVTCAVTVVLDVVHTCCE
jgi:hypothetical protein